MRFIKRLIFILLLLVVAFFIYRLISPTGAQQLLSDLTTFSNDTIGTHFSVDSGSISSTGSVLDMTGVITTGTIITGNFLEQTGTLQELTGDEELMFDTSFLQQDTTGIIVSGTTVSGTTDITVSPVVPVSDIPIIPPTTITRTTSSNGLSAQDKNDIKKILQNFGN